MKINLFLCACVFFVAIGATGFAQDAATIKSRMKQRLPQIIELKKNGAIGENNEGFLEIRKEGGDASIVEKENADRKMVYQAIARKEGTTMQVVGKRRATQIAEKAAAGDWLQGEYGKWFRK